MFKNYIQIFFLFLFIFNITLYTNASDEVISNVVINQNLPFKIGEQICYNVNCNGFNIGEMFLTYYGINEYEGQKFYKITSEAHTFQYDGIDTIYVDIEKFIPIKVIRELKYLRKKELIQEFYDQEKKQVIIKKIIGKKEIITVFKKEKYIQNSILLYYLTRLKTFNLGESFEIVLPVKNYTIKINKIETLKINNKEKIDAYLFESIPSGIEIWISKDDKKIPLKIRFTKFLSLVTMNFKEIRFVNL